VIYVFNTKKNGTRQMDESSSLPVQLDQLDEFKVLFDHLSNILPLQMREQFSSNIVGIQLLKPKPRINAG